MTCPQLHSPLTIEQRRKPRSPDSWCSVCVLSEGHCLAQLTSFQFPLRDTIPSQILGF